ncbi:B12-binding domain-containing radical SAM protein [Thermodesulfobacteriota bacterium]
MKIALINICLRPDSIRRQLPVGLAYIATSIKKSGYDFDLIDMDIYRYSLADLEKILLEKEYDVFGFGCIVSGFRIARDIAQLIRKIQPKSIIIAGNSLAAALPELTLTTTDIDICVLKEGDYTMPELLRAIEIEQPLENVAGIAFMQNGEMVVTPARPFHTDLDRYGFPDWDLFDLSEYDKFAEVNENQYGEEMLICYPMTTARGCPYNCTFCYIAVRDKKIRYRRYSEDSIQKEVIRLYENYNARLISFWDDYSLPDKKTVQNRIDTMNNLPFSDVRWRCAVCSGLFTKEDKSLVMDLAASGCDNLGFSLENASTEILKAMNKKISVAGFIEQCHVLADCNITPLTSVIFGYPQETVESINLTLKVCEEANVFPSVGFILPLPGTKIYDWCREHNKITDDFKYLMNVGDRQDFHINLTSMSDETLIGKVTEGLQELAAKQGLELESVFKTGTYQKPQTPRS